MRLFVCTTTAMVMLWAVPAIAKEGLYIGGSLALTYIGAKTDRGDQFDEEYFDDLKAGPNFGLRVGWRLNDYFAAEAALTRSYHNTDFLGAERQVLEGQSVILKIIAPDKFLMGYHEGRYRLPQALGGMEPYFLIGVGRFQIGDSGGTYYKGPGIEYGLGLDLYLTPAVSVNAGLTGGTIIFTSGKFHGERDVIAFVTSYDIGIAYHF